MHIPGDLAAPDPQDIRDFPEFGAPDIAGDKKDDDGDVISDLLETNPEPGLPYATTPGEPRNPEPVAPTRLITVTATLLVDGGVAVPVKLLNADPNRIDLLIVTPVADPALITATARFYLASDRAAFVSPSVSALISASLGYAPISLGKHTGELWAIVDPTSATLPLKISAIATTK